MNLMASYTEIQKKMLHPKSKEEVDLTCSFCNADHEDVFHFTKATKSETK